MFNKKMGWTGWLLSSSFFILLLALFALAHIQLNQLSDVSLLLLRGFGDISDQAIGGLWVSRFIFLALSFIYGTLFLFRILFHVRNSKMERVSSTTSQQIDPINRSLRWVTVPIIAFLLIAFMHAFVTLLGSFFTLRISGEAAWILTPAGKLIEYGRLVLAMIGAGFLLMIPIGAIVSLVVYWRNRRGGFDRMSDASHRDGRASSSSMSGKRDRF